MRLRSFFQSPIHPLTLALASLLASVPCIRGSGTRVGFKDAFALARGNAFVATADNPSAIYYNPAGLTQIDGAAVSANLYAVSVASDYTGAAGTASMDDDYQAVPSFYAVWHPKDSAWAGGFGVYAPFGLSSDWGENSALRTHALKNEQTYLTYNLSGAWRLTPQLSLGGAVTYNRVSTDLRQGLGFVPGDRFEFSGDGDAAGFNLGLLWQPAPQHSFGLSYSHQTRIRMDGTATTTLMAPVTESARATFDFPEVIIAGWSYRPTPQWNLEVNIDWTNWDRLNTVTIAKGSGDQPTPFNWESDFFYEFGATRYFAGGWSVSAGYCFTANSVPDSSYTPAVPDSDRSFYSLGVGYRSARLSADLAWHYGDGGKRQVTGSPPSMTAVSADGIYDNAINAVSLSVAWYF